MTSIACCVCNNSELAVNQKGLLRNRGREIDQKVFKPLPGVGLGTLGEVKEVNLPNLLSVKPFCSCRPKDYKVSS